MQLRWYQEQAIEALRVKFAAGVKRIVLCKPTGSGKTVTFSALAARTVAKGGKVLILTDRTELLSQAGGALVRAGLEPALINPKNRRFTHSRCYVAMVETINRRLNKPSFTQALGHISLIIVDEAHKGNFRKVIERFPDSFIVGATATPLASSKTNPLNTLYEDIVEPVSIGQLIQEGYLVKARTFGPEHTVKQLKTKRGEYTDESQLEHFGQNKVYSGLIDNYKKLASGRRAMCFNVNVAHSLATVEALRAAGITAAHVDGETPADERKKILSDFRSGQFQILCNVGVFTTGFDEPSISCIILNRATKSLPLYLQICGRGSRPYPGKEDFIILDMGGNFNEHGRWQADHPWTDMFHNPPGLGRDRDREESEKEERLSMCGECWAVITPGLPVCPECGHVFPEPEPKTTTPKPFDEGPATQLLEITDDLLQYDLFKPYERMSVRELMFAQRARGYRPKWVEHKLKERGREALEEYAKLKGYRPGWVNHVLAKEEV
jgi:superfamily II DNA or RNA helicase